MRNEIILNNKSSKEITGLLIQELPPISKPMIRTTIEEIDGRDGDIITKLGYSAYNKQISIGLHGDFDINEVIKYFDSEGVVVFSNEPDKYYKYQIIDQIDFERLIRFRIAKVTMHCQPFKYSTTEESEEFEPGQTTGEGSEIELRPSAVSKINLNAAKGDTEQTTYSGKNKFNLRKWHNNARRNNVSNTGIDGSGNGFWMDYTAGRDAFIGWTYNSGTITNAADIASLIPVKPNMNYTISVSGTDSGSGTNTLGNSSYVTYVDSSYNVLNTSYIGLSYANAAVFETPANTAYVLFRIGVNGRPDTRFNFENIQLEEGRAKTSFEPYTGGIASPNPDYPQEVQTVTGEQIITIDDMDEQSQNFTVDLGDIELCKIGTYQDYIYKNGDDWYVHKEISKGIYDGSENWINHFSNQNRADVALSGYKTSIAATTIRANMFTPRFAIEDGSIFISNSVGGFSIVSKYADTIANWKTFLSTHQLSVYYILATPTNTQITDENLIEQLEALANANSYDEVTHVKSESENKPIILNMSVMSATSCEVTNEGNIYSKPTLTIYGSGTINLSLNNEQMFVIDLGEEDNYVTIDTNAMEAYKDTIDNLMNRSVDGNYNNFKLNIGTNTISWSGNLTKIVIDNYSRWI
jgi:predicted phage tail component-like protein